MNLVLVLLHSLLACVVQASGDDSSFFTTPAGFPYDPTCAIAYMQDQSKATCQNALDANGNPCKYCAMQGPVGALHLCLNQEQAQVAQGVGIECEEAEDDSKHEPKKRLRSAA